MMHLSGDENINSQPTRVVLMKLQFKREKLPIESERNINCPKFLLTSMSDKKILGWLYIATGVWRENTAL